MRSKISPLNSQLLRNKQIFITVKKVLLAKYLAVPWLFLAIIFLLPLLLLFYYDACVLADHQLPNYSRLKNCFFSFEDHCNRHYYQLKLFKWCPVYVCECLKSNDDIVIKQLRECTRRPEEIIIENISISKIIVESPQHYSLIEILFILCLCFRKAKDGLDRPVYFVCWTWKSAKPSAERQGSVM